MVNGFGKKIDDECKILFQVQLAITMAFISLFMYHAPARIWTMQNPWVGTIAFVTMFAVLIIMACCGEMRRKTPHNFIFLAMFTAAQGLMLGIVATAYDSNEVMYYIELEENSTNVLSNVLSGSHGSWHYMCYLCWIDPILVSDQMGFHRNGGLPFRGFVGCFHFWNYCGIFPWKCR